MIYDCKSNKITEAIELKYHKKKVIGFSFSDIGDILVSIGNDELIKLFNNFLFKINIILGYINKNNF